MSVHIRRKKYDMAIQYYSLTPEPAVTRLQSLTDRLKNILVAEGPPGYFFI